MPTAFRVTTRPWDVRNIDDYLNWLSQAVDYSGGYLEEPGVLEYQVFMDEFDDPIEALVGGQELVFPNDGSRLSFHLFVDREGRVTEYGFHLMSPAGEPSGRLCKNAHHMAGLGSESHFHPEGTTLPVEACPEFEFDDAVEFLRERKIWGEEQ